MFKKIVTVGALCVGLVAMFGGDAETHLAGYQLVNGTLKHTSSFECGISLKGVPNPDTHDARVECSVTVKVVQFQCENPTNQQVSGQSANRNIVLVAEDLIMPEDITDKKKGIATVAIHIPTTSGTFEITNEDCVNPNWFVVEDSVFVSEADALFQSKDCDTGTCTVAYRELLDCVIPKGFGYGKKQKGTPPPGTAYDCTVVFGEHLQ